MRALLGVLLLLVGLAVVGDRVAEHVAEGTLAGQLRRELGTRPGVEIGGFPFLTQAARGRYDDIALSAPSLRRDGVTVQGLRATLRDVQVPLSGVLDGSLRSVPVGRVTASGLVPWSELAAAAPVAGLRLSQAPGGDVRAEATFAVLGASVGATAVSTVRLDGDEVVLTPRDVDLAGASLPGRLADELRSRLDLRLPLPALPYDLRLTSLRTAPAGLTVSGEGTDVVLTR